MRMRSGGWYRFATVWIFTCVIAAGVIEAQSQILPVSQVKAGMKGKGRSVFEGSALEEFDVEVLGVLANNAGVGPKKNLILVRLDSERLLREGVAQGMSGSPIYIDGKLIGALAYSFAFAKVPIAGITPIEEMLAIAQDEETPRTFYSAPRPIQKYLSMEEMFTVYRDVFAPLQPAVYQGEPLTPMKIPLVFTGFSKQAFERSQGHFSRLGFSPVNAQLQSQLPVEMPAPSSVLKPGDAVGVQLITGDLLMDATGTVTYVDGKKVLAFGHPLYNLGSVEFGMAKAEVLGVIPSFNVTQKLAVSTTTVGKFVQDRASGFLGELGEGPRMIPVNIELQESETDIKNYRVNVVEDKILTPFLLNTAVTSLMLVEERSVGDLTLDFQGTIYLENGQSIQMEDLFSGNFDSSIGMCVNLITSVAFFLTNNEFKDLAIHRVDLHFTATEDLRMSTLEKVLLNKYDVTPGEYIQVKIYTRNFRGGFQVQEGVIPAPALPPGSEFYLIVSDTANLQMFERAQYHTAGFIPRSLDQMVRMLGSLRKNNRIYIKIVAEKPGLFLKGEEMPNLPPSMTSMFSSPRAASSSPTDLTRSTLFQVQVRVPYVFQGATVIPMKIK
jgi:hypothetical protein